MSQEDKKRFNLNKTGGGANQKKARPLMNQDILYRKASVEIDESYLNYNEINEIYNFMRDNKIKIIKYNNTFD